ncbi:SPOR domain-containing protein [Seongchinamella unica]|nr:SPOR domain-containing protein [Seongchinamella unica]
MGNRDDDHTQWRQGDEDQPHNDSLFSDFDDDEFEDSDRDSDFAAIYTEVEEEPELPAEDNTWELIGSTWELVEESPEEDAAADIRERWDEAGEFGSEEPDLWNARPNPPGAFDDEPPDAEDTLAMAAIDSEDLDDPTGEAWEEFEDDEELEEEGGAELSISLGMIVVAVVALVLMGAGGYGVIEQRAGMQEEIRELQAKLATAAPPHEVAAARLAAEEATERSTRLEQQVEQLARENRSLEAIVSGLEKQLTAQQEAIKKAPPPAKAAPAATVKPAPAKPATGGSSPATAGSWFVNFSSYTLRSTAESWVNKLQPGKGRVIVTSGDSNGRTIYRVRVVDLPDKASAEAIARSLEQQYDLPKLWVGRSG